VQLAPAVAADGHERPVPVVIAQMLEPGLPQHRIDEAPRGVDQDLDRLPRPEAGLQLLVGLTQELAYSSRSRCAASSAGSRASSGQGGAFAARAAVPRGVQGTAWKLKGDPPRPGSGCPRRSP